MRLRPHTLLERVRAAGLELTVEGPSLVVYPAGRLSPALEAELVLAKPLLLALLAGDPDGVTVLGSAPERQPGRGLEHPWTGRLVASPAGVGRLRWTDGFRAGVRADEDGTLHLVDLADVYLNEARAEGPGERSAAG
jgi:hypothetical protein